ncbi:MAG TPA: FkbM family methyltransferase [Gaiellaceae bacterium]|jgi:FkbM family methyltransferase
MRSGLKATVQGLLRHRVGIDVVRWPPPVTEDWRVVVALLPRLGVDTVLDVGAHRGESGTRLRRAGFEGRLISFEPLPSAFQVLEQAARDDPRWTAVPIALGSEDSERELVERRWSELSSFLPVDEAGLAIAAEPRQAETTVRVPVRRLDSVLDDYTKERLFAKVDTQGYDLEVVRGAAGVLDRLAGLHLELAVQQTYVGQPDYLTVLAELRGLGYEPVGFFREGDPCARIGELNGVFVRT